MADSISEWDTSNVTDINSMFVNCNPLDEVNENVVIEDKYGHSHSINVAENNGHIHTHTHTHIHSIGYGGIHPVVDTEYVRQHMEATAESRIYTLLKKHI